MMILAESANLIQETRETGNTEVDTILQVMAITVAVIAFVAFFGALCVKRRKCIDVVTDINNTYIIQMHKNVFCFAEDEEQRENCRRDILFIAEGMSDDELGTEAAAIVRELRKVEEPHQKVN